MNENYKGEKSRFSTIKVCTWVCFCGRTLGSQPFFMRYYYWINKRKGHSIYNKCENKLILES